MIRPITIIAGIAFAIALTGSGWQYEECSDTLSAVGRPARHMVPEQPETAAREAAAAADNLTWLSPAGKFSIIYTTTGTSAVPAEDSDADGVPDWVERTGHWADSALAVYESWGYNADIGSPYPIQFLELSGSHVYGYSEPASSTYPYGLLKLDDDFAESLYDTKGYDALAITMVHELFHAVQRQYYFDYSLSQWWLEQTAVFTEDRMFNDVNDYYYYVNPSGWYSETFYEDPSTPLTYANGLHEYGGVVFPRFIWERFGDTGLAAIRNTFVRMESTHSGSASVILDAITDVVGMDVKNLIAEFWVWSYFTGERARDNQFFREAAYYTAPPSDAPDRTDLPRIAAADWVVSDMSTRGTAADTVITSRLGGWMVRIPPDGSSGGLQIRVAGLGTDADKWAWRVAVAYPDTVLVMEPVSGIVQFGWQSATDVVLTAGNEEISSSSVRFRYIITYDNALSIASDEENQRPRETALGQNMPNPFNPTTTIPVALSESGPVTLEVFDITGRRVRTLARSEYRSAGEHRFVWNGLSDDGRASGAGVYIARLLTPGRNSVIRMTLAR